MKFLVRLCGGTRRSYATDVKLFAAWCAEAKPDLIDVPSAPRVALG